MAKSRVYDIDDSKVSFEFGSNGKLIGIKKDGKSLDPQTQEFEDFQDSDDALDAYNVNKFGGNINAYEEIIDVDTDILIAQHEREEKKQSNEQFVDNVSEQSLAFSSPRDTGSQYDARNVSKNKSLSSSIMAYPLDIDLAQDHFKITKYKYQRADINLSKPSRTRTNKDGQTVNVAGDSVLGSKLDGSVILPMPKATDANAAGWGGSDLTATELGTLGLAQQFDQDPTNVARFLGLPSLSGVSTKEIKEQFDAKIEKARAGELDPFGGIVAGTQAFNASTLAKLTGILGANIDTDTFLARTGGRVLNPNAEMLFQGPVIRDFSFEFQMIARSRREGDEIRKIIRFFKLGMAPKFQNIGFLANPDVFKLEYRNNRGTLKTVNRFNPGGLALTTLKTDYAPNGYWAAYTDSQPVALKLSLAFTELRPIYEGDQEATPTDSVGY